MKNIKAKVLIMVTFIGLFTLFFASSTYVQANSCSYADGDIIVCYEGATIDTLLNNLNNIPGYDNEVYVRKEWNKFNTFNDETGNYSIYLLHSDSYSTEQLINMFDDQPNVKYVEPNYCIKNFQDSSTLDTSYKESYNQNTIKAQGLLYNEPTKESVNEKEKVVVIIDSGIDYTHEDIKESIWVNHYSQDVLEGTYGYDFINEDADPMDDYFHGTHCAGIILNNVDYDIKLMALKIMNEHGEGYLEDAISAYQYIQEAQRLGVNIVAINNSWGSTEQSKIFEELVESVGKEGAITVVAAGNESSNIDDYFISPASMDSPYVITVAGLDAEENNLLNMSNYGNCVDIAAPGANLLSTVNYYVFNPNTYKNKNKLCSLYYDFSKPLINYNEIKSNKIQLGNVLNCKNPVFYLRKNYTNSSVLTSQAMYYGNENRSSCCWDIGDAKEGEQYALLIPFIVLGSDTDYYTSVMLRQQSSLDVSSSSSVSGITTTIISIDENGDFLKYFASGGSVLLKDDANYWTHLNCGSFANSEKTLMAVVLEVNIYKSGDYKIYIDDFGISKENVEANNFGKYEYFTGTSGSAPFVTAAVATVNEVYPNIKPENIKFVILSNASRIEEDKSKPFSNFVLNLEKLKNRYHLGIKY